MRPTGHRVATCVLALLPIVVLFRAALAQTELRDRPTVPGSIPFAPGERLEYTARVARLGRIGAATMWIDGTEEVRGISTYVLRFDFRARKGPISAEEHSASWLDPGHFSALRFHKHERNPLSRSDEHVELFPVERRWQAEDGRNGTSLSDVPLDELSFMYLIRTLRLAPDTVYRLERHFDAERNPTMLRVLQREMLRTPAGEFNTVLIEMRVRDPRRYRGEGVIRINVSEDEHRLPVRIVSAMPLLGRAVLTLESHSRQERP